MATLLANVLTQNDLHDGEVVEPYAGGAGASLQLLFDEFASTLRLNDADPRIYAFWRAILNQTESFIAKLHDAVISMQTWHECRRSYERGVSRQSQLDIAFSTFFLNRANRSGILMGGGPVGGYKQNGKWKIDARFNKAGLIQRIRRIADYRERISVTKLDGLALLKSLPKTTDRRLVYLDPPYYQKGQRLYLNSFDHRDHSKLAKYLLGDPPFRWILTYDNVPEIRGLYAKLNPRPFELSYSAYGRRKGRELIIFDPRLKVDEEMLQQHNRPGSLQFTPLG